MKKPIDVFLTKEAFNQYAQRLREQTAKEHGLTLEEWDSAILHQQTVTPQPTLFKAPQPCLHSQCDICKGSGFNLTTGQMCVHNISCSCPKCTPSY